MYDIIGDIHGHDTELMWLFGKLGYRLIGGAWRHPERKTVFLGDFIDRGTGSHSVIDTVRRMVDAGTALAVMGNHEFNAIAYHTPHPERAGEFLRPHSEKNTKQHQATLDGLKGKAADDMLAWFYSLPLWLELDGIRVVHAFWDEAAIATLTRRGAVDGDHRLKPEALHAASTPGDEVHEAVERLLKGLEITLPGGLTYKDKEGNVRSEIRVRWWDAGKQSSWRRLVVGEGKLAAMLPADEGPVPPLDHGYPEEAPPVFVGHYWYTGVPAPLTPNVACVDYSVAKEGGALVAYRWDGETTLKSENFVSVARRAGESPGAKDWAQSVADCLNRAVKRNLSTS